MFGVPPKSHDLLLIWYHPKWNGRVLSIQGWQLYYDLDCIWMMYLGLSEKDGIPQSLANHRGKHIFNPYSKKPIFGWYQDDIWIYGGFIKNRATPCQLSSIYRSLFPINNPFGVPPWPWKQVVKETLEELDGSVVRRNDGNGGKNGKFRKLHPLMFLLMGWRS